VDGFPDVTDLSEAQKVLEAARAVMCKFDQVPILPKVTTIWLHIFEGNYKYM
jgi:hypothetical protein